MRISQSMIKDLIKYQEGKLCGLQFVEKYIKGNFDKFFASGAMSIGTWFEYQLTGALPKDGRIPLPEKTTKGELTAPYKKMLGHVADFKATMLYYGFEIVSIGEKISHGDLEGTLDLRLKATQTITTESGIRIEKGEVFFVDLKTSGLLDNKWADYGWEIDNLSNKHNLVMQPILYKYIEMKNTGKDVKFLFFLYNTNDSTDSRIINFVCDEDAYLDLEVTIKNARILLERHTKKGWKAKPSKSVCAKCPIKIGCPSFTGVPPITDFFFTPANA
jgi:hypothetical protein